MVKLMEEIILTKKQTPIEIALDIDETGHTTAKKLYAWLELNPTHYAKWIKANITENLFASEGVDFTPLSAKSTGGRPSMDYLLSASFAKKLAMSSRTLRGEEARNYFIEVEKALVGIAEKKAVKPEKMDRNELIALALIEAQAIIEEQAQVIEQQTPLVEFANHVSSATESIEIGTLAKLANKQGIEIGRNRLFNWLRDKKYLMQNNEPYQQYVNQGYFKLIEKTNNTPYGPTIYTQTLVTGKGQIWIIEQLRKEFGSK